MEEKRGNPLKCPDCGGFGSYDYSGYCRKCFDIMTNETNDFYIKTPTYPGAALGFKTAKSFFRQKHGNVDDYGTLDSLYGYEKRGFGDGQ